MTTAARTQSPRSAPPQPHELESTKLQPSTTQTTIPNQHNNTSMTWQQKEEFMPFSKPRKNNRNRYHKKSWQDENKEEAQIAATDEKALAQATASQAPTYVSQDNKTVIGKEYVPPHLRNRPSANGAAAKVSPFSSATTKSTALTKPDLTPSRDAVHNLMPPSPPTTPREPVGQEKLDAAKTQTNCDDWNDPPLCQTSDIKKSGNQKSGNGTHDSWNNSLAWQTPVAQQPGNGACDIWDESTAWPPAVIEKTPAFKRSGKQKSGNGRWDTRKDHSDWDALNDPENRQTLAVKQPANLRGPRRQPYKKHVWPKNKDMKPIPSSDNDDGGVQWKSDSNGDPDYDVKKLTDWNGDWMPPPESWCGRRQWDDRHFGEHLEQWLNKIDPKCVGAIYYPSDTFNPEEGPCKELAPRYWLEVKVENTNLRESWKIISASQPKPLDDDPINPSPWWELYEDVVYTEIVQKCGQESQSHHASSYLNAVPVPEAKIDLTDPDNFGPPHYMISAADKIQDLKREREEQHRRMIARRNRPVPQPTIPMVPVQDRSLHPLLNIYLRPVQAADVADITAIYNWYVERSFHVPEFDARTEDQMRHRINAITNANLPYLVAILKKTPSKPTPGYVSEKLVGWINLDEYCGRTSLYRYTFETELFVHPGHRSKGIGKCLMDKLLEMADGSYRVRGGYEYVNNYEYLKNGPGRVIKTILVNCHHENSEDADKEWQGKFLRFCKFHRVGRLPTVGYKNGKVVDVSIYAHHTKEDINPNVPPA